jgi:predicted  nucleic acid-binding Zn-ribbon protein
MSFDSLTYARRLKAAGFSEAQAEALADANRELLMSDLATKDDIGSVMGEIGSVKGEIASVRGEIDSVRGEIGSFRADVTTMDQRLRVDMATMDQRLRTDMAAQEQRLLAAMEALGLRLTIRLGVMMGAAVAILGAILHMR